MNLIFVCFVFFLAISSNCNALACSSASVSLNNTSEGTSFINVVHADVISSPGHQVRVCYAVYSDTAEGVTINLGAYFDNEMSQNNYCPDNSYCEFCADSDNCNDRCWYGGAIHLHACTLPHFIRGEYDNCTYYTSTYAETGNNCTKNNLANIGKFESKIFNPTTKLAYVPTSTTKSSSTTAKSTTKPLSSTTTKQTSTEKPTPSTATHATSTTHKSTIKSTPAADTPTTPGESTTKLSALTTAITESDVTVEDVRSKFILKTCIVVGGLVFLLILIIAIACACKSSKPSKKKGEAGSEN